MINILVCHFGSPWESLVASSLIKAISRSYSKADIYWATTSENSSLFKYNKLIKGVYIDYENSDKQFEVIINLTPSIPAASYINNISSNKKIGFIEKDGAIFSTNIGAEEAYNVLTENKHTDKNIFQVFYRIAEMKWKGEGYDLCYFPKTKTKKSKTGIAIADENLRFFVKNNLQLGLSESWHIPLKQNLLKRIDEINVCKNIVTDDMFTLHVSIALKKHVEYLDCFGLNYSVEFFGTGSIHRLF